MNFKKQPPLSAREISILGLIGILAVVVVSVLAGANIGLSRVVQGGGGFFVAWEGARGQLFAHTDPYGNAVAMLAQEHAYGRYAGPGENPYFLTIPFFLLPFYFPFALISDPMVARGLWMLLSELALAATAVLSWRLTEWEPRRWFLILFTVLSLFGYYAFVSLLDGAPLIPVGLIYLGILLSLSTEQDELAGTLLVFTLFYWEVGFPFVLLLLWRVFLGKRWRVLAGFAMLLSVLLIISFLIYPGWIYPFVTATVATIRTNFGLTTAAILVRLMPAYGGRVAQVLTLLIIIMLGFEWAATRASDFRRFIWAACLTLAATPLLSLRTEMGNLIVMLPGLALIFAAVTNRWRMNYWLTVLLLLIVFLVPWSFFTQWLLFHRQFWQDMLFLFYPLFIIIGLYWTRWWFIRPPRTWLDHVRSTLK